MLKGVQLQIWIGPAVPVPAQQPVIEALESAEVTVPTYGRSEFQLTFSLSPRSILHTLFLVSAGAEVPLVRVILAATVNGRQQVLIDGVMTHHQVAPGGSGGAARLVVTGEDLTRVMDYLEFNGVPYPALPPEARVVTMLAKYAGLGVLPLVVPSVMIDVPIPVKEIPRQEGTDYQYITSLANDVGYVFYLEPGPQPGVSRAYWGPLVKVGAPQPALNVDMNAHTNTDALNFAYDPDQRVLPVVYIQDEISKLPLPVPIADISPLNPPLGLISPLPKGLRYLPDTAKMSPMRAALTGMAHAARSAESVVATGTLDVVRYGRLLKSRGLVGVRGVGTAYDGLYYVDRVTHHIKRGEYKQSFRLTRNGLISTLARIPA